MNKDKNTEYITGVISIKNSGHAYLTTEDDSIFVHKNNLGNALDGDEVSAFISLVCGRRGDEEQGFVDEVIKRGRTEFTGVIDIMPKKGFAFVKTSSDKMPVDFFVSIENIGNAKNGDVVVVRLQRWNSKDKNPKGIVVRILGKANTHETDLGIIMNKHGIEQDFSDEVMKEVDGISEEITQEEILKRTDFRDTLTFSIDGADARDLDDALSFKVLDNGNYEIGVHIADVSHYVKRDGEIDKEALRRGTSIYLVSSCISMLPEKLSNDLCSLNKNTDKLTASVIFEITSDGEIKNHTFKKSIINSNYRLTYEEVQIIIENEYDDIQLLFDGSLPIYDLVDAIVKLNSIAKVMRDKRFDNGGISFNSREPKFILDDNNVPIDVAFSEMKDSNKLIEEYMLLANRYVGTFLYKNKIPAAFRVHDSPDEERLLELSNFVKRFGYELNITGDQESVKKSLNKLLSDTKDTSEGNMISALAVRCLSKAVCSATNFGHYGLGEDFMPPNAYAWFTSPIRRMADLCNHRQLFGFLESNKNKK